ncbi:MAG TPA: hypothetical protein VE132_15785 [Micromonosporaceae bacterium]|nr:hypothetical protein [Micromonosporaceae bacterium]
MVDADVTAARQALHGVAELVVAGPQYRRSGTIRMRVIPGGFGSIAEPDVRVDGAYLVAGGVRVPLVNTTIADLATAAGVHVGAPAGLYEDGSGADPGDEVDVDAAAAAYLANCLALGDAALRRVEPAETPVLWPEHFDLGITAGEINFGVSLGDSWLGEPYAYVAPWQPRSGEFWTTGPFGAAVPLRERGDVDSLVAFFFEGAERAQLDPVATL